MELRCHCMIGRVLPVVCPSLFLLRECWCRVWMADCVFCLCCVFSTFELEVGRQRYLCGTSTRFESGQVILVVFNKSKGEEDDDCRNSLSCYVYCIRCAYTKCNVVKNLGLPNSLGLKRMNKSGGCFLLQSLMNDHL